MLERFRAYGSRPAVLVPDRVVGYAELADAVAATADRLGPVRRLVAITARNDLATLTGYLGALAGGHAVLPLTPGADSTELLDRHAPDVLLDGTEPDQRRAGTRHRLHPELTLLLSTSGSTGAPKLVRLSATNLTTNAAAIAEYLAIGPDDRAITSLPFAYCYGLSVVHSHLFTGAGLIVTDRSVTDEQFWTQFERHGGTSLAGVPYTFELLERTGFAERALPRLRYLTQAGGRMEPQRVRRFAQLGADRGWQLFVMYGATEATARMAYLPPELAARRPESIGRPIPGGEFRLDPVDEQPDDTGGRDDPSAEAGTVGELVYRGPNVMLGYATGPADLAAGATVHELRTGDIARRDPDGLYQVIGRRNRLAKLFGLRIDLQRVESALAAAGIPAICVDDGAGMLLVAVTGSDSRAERVVTESTGLPATAVRLLRLDALPRLPNGKPDLHRVRALGAQPAADVVAAPVTGAATTVAAIRTAYAEVLQLPLDRVGEQASFVGLGGDSLTYVAMSVRLERLLHRLPGGWHTMTVAELAASAQSRTRRGIGATVETSVALRAAAIVLVVSAHAGLFQWWGGAHVLLAVAGYNFARFRLTGRPRTQRIGQLARTTAWIAGPTIAWVAVIMVVGGVLGEHYYGWSNLLLTQKLLGPHDSPTAGHLWFVEVLVWILIGAGTLLAIPAVDRWQRRRPFAVAATVLLAGLAVRFGPFGTGPGATYSLLAFWFFALGWAAAAATDLPRRLLVTAGLVVGLLGYFDSVGRGLLVGIGIAGLIWLPNLRCPALLATSVGAVAEASLFVYLVHWQVYPLFGDHRGFAVAASLLAGVACTRAVTEIRRAARQRAGGRRNSPATHTEQISEQSYTIERA
ncbi:AMP-binding protein [Skermania piniformis]|uniref:AMP-binding protein n=1 Tax=Skermania pinensis TaxID=39122 RepID=A0ABX8SE18_9ACTN|nr:AMP-binding protein [Skermania piniformis]